ncbi:hypothetical protein [Lysinibacillus sp. RC79]|uniref:hypothetical protein n=1 Tax=Lysinibacillus sp. RC79 TaxID=3156296 RepID=UPI0035128A48
MAEKTVNIYGEDVTFKVTGQTPLMYRAMYPGSDFLKDFMNLEKNQAQGNAFESIEFYQMVYCLAKKANPEIPEINVWLDTFENGFPVMEIVNDVLPLIQANFISTQLKKKATRAKK